MNTSVTILGSTGVIGSQTLEFIRTQPSNYRILGLCAGRNMEKLAQQIREFTPQFVSVQTEQSRRELIERIADFKPQPEIGVGDEGLLTAASLGADILVTGIVGVKGLVPTWRAIAAGSTVALANKETLVSAGDLVMRFAQQQGVPILPVDSEHSALHQSLRSGTENEVSRYILTASGGPFRTWSQTELERATVEQALRHPNWTMGRKITIDSATMMNKGLEVIEAHYLFDVTYDRIEVVVHPQSTIHSMVEYVDGSIIAQLATPDMRLPIQYALTYPRRSANPWPKLNVFELQNLTFEAPDFQRFPSLQLAYEAGRAGGFAPCVLNAANEVVVEGFLEGRISFLEMAKLIERVLEQHIAGDPQTIEDVLEMDEWARQTTATLMREGR